MIVDSSAIIAIVRNEPDAKGYVQALASSASAKMSAANWFETAIVIDSARDPVASRRFDEIIDWARIDVVAVTPAMAEIARRAYRDFGRGSASPAKLNFGDCFAYALAADTREPLLFKGNDFVHTDLTPAEVPTT